jgi:hypothetical protein
LAPPGFSCEHENRRYDGTEVALQPSVTVRITVEEAGPTLRILVDGRLTRDAVGDLERTIGIDPQFVVLDLANLRSADAAGVAALRRLRAAGAVIEGARPHLAWRIYGSET